jgi:AcrR family transcriptional regulator
VGQSSPTLRPATEKGRARRDQIVASAITLFYERGYHATGIDEIGEAAGITGPGVYRHFGSKDDILAAILDRVWMMLKEGIDESTGLPPANALDVLIGVHVRTAVTHGPEIALMYREMRNLPTEYQTKARRNRRSYEDTWARHIVALHPEHDEEEGRMVARSVFWLINAYAADPTRPVIGRDRSTDLLTSMARRVVGQSGRS